MLTVGRFPPADWRLTRVGGGSTDRRVGQAAQRSERRTPPRPPAWGCLVGCLRAHTPTLTLL